MLDRRIPRLRAHRSLQPTYVKSSLLQPERNEVEEADKLAKYNAFRRSILQSKIGKLFNKGFDLGRRPPGVEVKSA